MYLTCFVLFSYNVPFLFNHVSESCFPLEVQVTDDLLGKLLSPTSQARPHCHIPLPQAPWQREASTEGEGIIGSIKCFHVELYLRPVFPEGSGGGETSDPLLLVEDHPALTRFHETHLHLPHMKPFSILLLDSCSL